MVKKTSSQDEALNSEENDSTEMENESDSDIENFDPSLLDEELVEGEKEEEELDPVAMLEKQLKETENELLEKKEAFLRYQAETENFKRRLTKEKNDYAQFANEKLIKALLPIYDNLDRALSVSNATVESLNEGVQMIFKQFTSFLEKEKVKPIPAMGEKFDPSKHEVLNHIPSEEHEEGTIIEEYAKGYFLNDRVILPAKVVIAKKPPESEEAPDTATDSENPPTIDTEV